MALQVPLGTVVHKVAPALASEETYEDEEPFKFQQHWVGARDYVSSDEETDSDSSPHGKDAQSEPNLEVTGTQIVLAYQRCHDLRNVDAQYAAMVLQMYELSGIPRS